MILLEQYAAAPTKPVNQSMPAAFPKASPAMPARQKHQLGHPYEIRAAEETVW